MHTLEAVLLLWLPDDPLNTDIIIQYNNENNILVYQYAMKCPGVFIYSYSKLDLA